MSRHDVSYSSVSTDPPLPGRSGFCIALIVLVVLLSVIVFSQWRHSTIQAGLEQDLDQAIEFHLNRQSSLLSLDAHLQRGYILDIYATALQGQEDIADSLEELREGQQILASPELRLWESRDARNAISEIFRLLEKYASLDPTLADHRLVVDLQRDRARLVQSLQTLQQLQNAAGSSLSERRLSIAESAAELKTTQWFLFGLTALPVGFLLFLAVQHRGLLWALSRAQNEARAFFKALPEPALLINEQEQIEQANRACCRLLDYDETDLLGKSIFTLLPPRFIRSFRSLFTEAEEGRELVLLDRHGSEVEVTLRFHRSRFAGKPVVIVNLHDTREQNRLYQQLNTSRKRFDMALAATRDGMWDWDLKKHHVEFSHNWLQMLGFRPDWVCTDPHALFRDSVPEEDRELLFASFRKFLRSRRQIFRAEHRLRHRDGHLMNVICRACAERDDSGRITRLVGSHSDVTEIRSQQAEVFKLNRRLEDLLQDQSDAMVAPPLPIHDPIFLSVLGHEVRTPLHGVMNMAELLAQGKLSGDDRQMVDSIKRSSLTLLRTVDDILDYAALQANEIEELEQQVDVVAAMESLLEESCQQGAAASQQVYFYPAPDLPAEIWLDGNRFNKIVRQLLENALKFSRSSKPNGVVKMWLAVDEDATEAAAATLQLKVWDNGVGIAEKELNNIFRPFSRGEKWRSREHDGSGLGLAICAKLTRLLGGTIVVDSQQSQFTEVTVRLPIKVVRREVVKPGLGQGVMVDVVDEALRLSVVDMVSRAGYQVYPVGAVPLRHDGSLAIITDRLDSKNADRVVQLVPRRSVLLSQPGQNAKEGSAVSHRQQIFTDPLIPSSLLGSLVGLHYRNSQSG